MKRPANRNACILLLAFGGVWAAANELLAQVDVLPPDAMDSPPAMVLDAPAENSYADDVAVWPYSPVDDCGCCADGGYGRARACGPPWTIYVGSMLTTRDAPDRADLLLVNPFFPLVRSQSLDFDVEGGVEFCARNEQVGIGNTATEVRFAFYGEWNSLLRRVEDDPLIATDPLTTIAGDQDITVGYHSRVLGFEINALECQYRPVTFLAGFRYLNLDEELSMYFHNPNLPAGPAMLHFAYWDATNDLFGGQIGANFRVYEDGGPLRVNCLLKAGAFLNDAHSHVLLRTNFGTGPSQGNFDEVGSAFVGEFGLNLAYDVACYATVRAGYNLLWIDGVSLASEQVRGTGNLTAANSIRIEGNDGSVLFHGATLGVEFRH